MPARVVSQVVLCLLLFGSAGVPAACGDRAVDLPLPPVSELPLRKIQQVWASSPRDVYVVGEWLAVRHFSGGEWRPVGVVNDAPAEAFDGTVLSVGGTAKSDVWIEDLYHFDGSSWHVRTKSPGGAGARLMNIRKGADGVLYGLRYQSVHRVTNGQWGKIASFSDIITYGGGVWADANGLLLVAGMTLPATAVSKSIIRSFNGNIWADETTAITGRLRNLWGEAGAAIYAVGYNDSAGLVLRRHAGTWSPLTTDPIPPLYDIHGNREHGAFVSGDGIVYRIKNNRLVLFHEDPSMTFPRVFVVQNHVLVAAVPKNKSNRSKLLAYSLDEQPGQP